ncbi:MAG: peptide chain release factor N(5)-glutamine methyltransferase, partial [Christensenellaceae bacterium]|nr:peptide chain release factor N(5)-glutamine methyltransferase [Christensenellaceae bacterium]
MKIFDAINWGFSVLFDNNIPNPKVDTEYILSYILDIDRFNLYLNKDKLLTENEIKKFEDLINIRKTRKPLQYILKYTNFYGLDFYVDENVLIPRPETEYLCEHAINIIGNKSLKILDLCTGSGAIAITISKQCPNSIVYGSDISEKALNI